MSTHPAGANTKSRGTPQSTRSSNADRSSVGDGGNFGGMMKLRVGKELTELMQWASANTGYSMSKIVVITLRCHARQPLNIESVDDPGGGAGGTVITIDAPDGMDQETLRRLLWVKLVQERSRDKKRPLQQSTAVENKDYVLVEDVSNLKFNKKQIDEIMDHLYADK